MPFITESVLDYDKGRGKVSTESADKILSPVAQHGYSVSEILKIHADAHHATASRYLQAALAKRRLSSPRPEVSTRQRIERVKRTVAERCSMP